MKKSIFMLIAMLVFGFASAQVNKTDPPTAAVPSPGSAPVENATQKINRENARQGAPTSLLTRPQVSTPPSTTVTEPIRQPNPLRGTDSPYPGGTLAYPEPQGAQQPGTIITTEPQSGTNNQRTTLPASNTTNQGKVP
jgi:hypothetical protein